MKVLIGVDDSPHSEAAIEFTRKMCWTKDTRFLIVSAVLIPIPVYSEMQVPTTPLVVESIEELTRFARGLVERTEEKLKPLGFQVEARVLEGDPRAALVDAARDERVDLMVVGSHGRTGLEKLLMGSVASHVVAHAPCSVLVVKMNQRR